MRSPASTTSADAPRQRAWRELRAAPGAGITFLARAWAAVPVVEVSLRVLGYRRTLGWIEGVPVRPEGAGASVVLGERLVAAAYRAQPWPGGCLPRSLVQYLLHRRDGTPARFVVGVRKPDRTGNGAANDRSSPGIEAHAWVEGPADAPAAADRFVPIFDAGDI